MPGKIQTVNWKDELTGLEEKEKCHDGEGILHRAFVLMLFNGKGDVLLTRRSRKKRLWPGYWEASIASHIREGKSVEQAALRRAHDELGIRIQKAEFLLKFRYKIPYMDKGSENEICHVLAAVYSGKIKPNQKEISECRHIGYSELKDDCEKPDYSPWMKIAIRQMAKHRINPTNKTRNI
ncbi:isopentenyl-diphosphate Delta-isomerase [Candidatus Woesearchaeota archaeon]|nr:isopentenyl-diphosphate Delta-isomerase [Candidatus Woesearchaeota archaeon]